MPDECSLFGPFAARLTSHDFLRQSFGQLQRLVLNLAVRQCLPKVFHASVAE